MVVEPEAEVILLPDTWTQTCYACTHAMFGDRGTYCGEFRETILFENLAGQDCEAFESSDGKAYVRVDL